MLWKNLILVAAAAVALCTSPALAQDGGGRRDRARERVLERFDADGDGRLDDTERAQAREARAERRGGDARGERGERRGKGAARGKRPGRRGGGEARGGGRDRGGDRSVRRGKRLRTAAGAARCEACGHRVRHADARRGDRRDRRARRGG